MVATDELIDVWLELGQHAEVVADLTALTSRHPLRERLWAQLMLPLCPTATRDRCGRQADALQAYRAVAGRLADELAERDPERDAAWRRGASAARPFTGWAMKLI